MKIWSGWGRDEEPMDKAILFDKETACTPLPGAPTIDRISSKRQGHCKQGASDISIKACDSGSGNRSRVAAAIFSALDH